MKAVVDTNVVAYLLLDLKRRGLTIRPLVRRMEQAVIRLLAEYGVTARGRPEAPGVYVGARKLASLGLRVRRGCSYHGLALNVDLDLEPFRRIDPCGLPGLEMTRLCDLGIDGDVRGTAETLAPLLCAELGLQWDGKWSGA